MRVFFNFVLIQIVFNLYVFYRGWKILPDKKAVKTPFLSIFVIELIGYFIGFIFSEKLPADILHILAWGGTSWALFISYISVLLIVYDLTLFIERKKRILPTSINLNKKTNKRIYYCTTVVLVLILMLYGNYRFKNPTVVNKTIELSKYSPNVNELKIAVVSDIHAGLLINKAIVSMYVDRIMEQKPDMILIAGDIIDYDLQSVIDQDIHEEFQRLQAPYGVFACTGNHDYIDVDSTEFAKAEWLQKNSGFTLLQDTAIMIHNSIYLAGRNDEKAGSRKNLSEILKNVDKKYPVIVINHRPDNINEEVENGVDIAVYGHTHNGQLFPANLWINSIYELGYGYKKKGDSHLYVSSGIGLAGPQYRIGTISEILILDVKFNK